MKPAIDDNACSVPFPPAIIFPVFHGTWYTISGKRAKCSLSKLVTGDIFHLQKLFDAGGGMHPPHPPPWIRHCLVWYNVYHTPFWQNKLYTQHSLLRNSRDSIFGPPCTCACMINAAVGWRWLGDMEAHSTDPGSIPDIIIWDSYNNIWNWTWVCRVRMRYHIWVIGDFGRASGQNCSQVPVVVSSNRQMGIQDVTERQDACTDT